MSDLRGPMRKWIEIKETSSATFIMFECGHVGEMNPIFDYSLDPQHHCFQCGQDEINIPQKGDGGILRGSSNSSQVRDSLISGVVTGAGEEPRKSESTESRPRRLMRLPKNSDYPNYNETHLEDAWCAKVGCAPVCSVPFFETEKEIA